MGKMRMRWLCVLCALVMVGGVFQGQDRKDETAPSDGRHYQVVFVAQELEGGKIINSRRYETDMALQGEKSGSGSIRTGSKIPLATGSYSGAQSQVQTQFTYIDVGVNLDFNHAHLEGDRVFLFITAEISSAGAESIIGGVHEPIIRQNKWSAGVTVPLGKPTVIFSSDDVSSKRTMQIELTVTPVR